MRIGRSRRIRAAGEARGHHLEGAAHELRVQGVDAVVFGTVEMAEVAPLDDPARKGEQATVRCCSMSRA